MDVTMPDGTVIQGVPDGTTKSQLLAKYQKFSAPASQPEDMFNGPRTEQAAQAIVDNMTGEQPSLPLTAIKVMGAGAGAVWDKAGQAASAVVPQSVKEGAVSGAQGVANAIDSTDAGQYVGDKLLAAKDAASAFASAHPEAVKVGGALANIAPMESLVNGVRGVAGNAIDAVKSSSPAEFLKNTASGGADVLPTPSKAIPTAIPSSAVKAASQNAYKYSEDVGGILNPDTFTNDVLDIIENSKAKPIAGKVLTAEQRALNNALDEYSPLRDSPLTITDYENFDKSLGAKESAAMNGFKPTNNSRIIGQIQDQVRDRLNNLKEDDVIGGKEGFDALTEHAIPLWSTQAKMADIENIINRANMMDNPTTAMRTGFRNLSLNKAKMASYPPDVQEMIGKAATNPSDMLGVLGSRLNPITSGTVSGKVTNMAVSKIFRTARDRMQNARAEKILSSMTNPVRDSVERFSTLPESPYPLKPELPVIPENPYFSLGAGTKVNPTPSESAIKALENIGGKDTPVDLQGTESSYYKKGGSVKKRNLTAEFLGRKYA